MVISPPFLPETRANESVEDYVRRAMQGDVPEQGTFPTSRRNQWHGGLHLSAPFEGGQALDVCAIADGTIAYVQRATFPRTDDPTHPLNYAGGWSSDGCVVLKHSTEIGEGPDGTVVFYSIYQHLEWMPDTIRLATVGQIVAHKDILGQAGYIYGKPDIFHFEIVADDDNAKRLMGRLSGDLPLGDDGRKDACYGDAYFYLPPGAEYCHTLANPQLSGRTPLLVRDTPGEPLFVGMRFENGQCTLTTYRHDGTVLGILANDDLAEPTPATTFGLNGTVSGPTTEAAPADDHYEYRMYKTARDQYLQNPSAGYELLRFGRVIGTADQLAPANAAHWRKIAMPSGSVWINLNSPGIIKSSDADFPHWRGWRMVDASAGDSRCNDEQILIILGIDTLAPLTNKAAHVLGFHQNATLTGGHTDEWRAQRFARAVVKSPTEWDATKVDHHLGWYTSPRPNGLGMSNEDFELVKQHAQALGFWTKANLGMDATPWHFEPREFIIHFKKCLWLSESELTQLLPSSVMWSSGGRWMSAPVKPTDGTTKTIQKMRVELNKALRKYGIAASHWRMAAFFGNATEETQWFGKLYEDNEAAWYHPWDGRGFLQLTGPDNYIEYWRFRGRTISDELKSELSTSAAKAHSEQKNDALQDAKHPDLTAEMIRWRDQLMDTKFIDASDSAGAYWAWRGAAIFADAFPRMVRETQKVGGLMKVYYSCESFGQVAATVNFGHAVRDTSSIANVNGIVARYQAYTNALMVLADRVKFPDARGESQDAPENYEPRKP